MKAIQKTTIIIIAIMLLMTTVVPAFASSKSKTIQEKAEVLNQLKILSGTDGQYRLNDQLRKSEAVTLIVRLLGQESEVLSNKDKYKITPYSDVASNQWFAPYVGYCCINGYISKYDTQFFPDRFIAMKEFIGMILMALEYRAGIDFTNDSDFMKALELGLLSDNDFINRNNQNYKFIRSSVVDIIYRALGTKTRSSNTFLCQNLIGEGIATRSQLLNMGLMIDAIPTGIEKVKGQDFTLLEITFNEKIHSVADVRIYAKSNEQETLFGQILSVSGNSALVETALQTVKKEYVIELMNVQDDEGNVTEKLSASFKGFESLEVQSDYFRIHKIEPVNTRSMKVYFTQPLNLNSEISLHYAIYKGDQMVADGKKGDIKAGTLNSDKNCILLSLNQNILNTSSMYTLRIDGDLTSAYGVSLNHEIGDSMKFMTSENQNTDSVFNLNSVTAIDKRSLLLHFNKEVNAFLAEQIFSYYLTDGNNNPIAIKSSVVDKVGYVVYLTTNTDLVNNKEYQLTINNLNDITRNEYITEKKFPFATNYATASNLQVTGMNVVDNQTIEVYFSRPLNKENITLVSNYSIYQTGTYSQITPQLVLFDPEYNDSMVKLYISKGNSLYANRTYELKVNTNVKDYLGNSIGASTISFNGTNANPQTVSISSVVPVSKDAVKVSFNKEIAFNATNMMPSNFSLEFTYNTLNIKKLPTSVLYIDAKTLILKFNTLENDLLYTLLTKEIIDFAGNSVKNLEAKFYSEAQ